MDKVREMVRTRKPQKPYDEMIELIAIGAAIRLSLKEKRTVYLTEV